MIQRQVAYWHGGVSVKHLSKILRNCQIVADTYDLVVREDEEKKALVAITTNLAFWVASKYGIDPVFGNY